MPRTARADLDARSLGIKVTLRVCLGMIVLGAWVTSASAQTRIACVGDSITAGYGVQAAEAYPAVLQSLFDAAEYEVANFGFSGATLMKSGNNPYWSTAQYAQSGEFEPHVVVLMLGTNDGKAANWANESQFDADYTELVSHYRDLGAAVYVAVPPPVFEPGAFDIVPQLVNEEVSAHVRALAIDLDAPLIDVFAAFEDQAALFPDKVHPNAEGARQLAQVIHDALEQGLAEPSASSSASPDGQGGAGAGGMGSAMDQGGMGAVAGSGGGDSPPTASGEQGQAGASEPEASAEPEPSTPEPSAEPLTSESAAPVAPGTSSPPEGSVAAPTLSTTAPSPPTPSGTLPAATTNGTSTSAMPSEPSPVNSMPMLNSDASASSCGCRVVGRRSAMGTGVTALAVFGLAFSFARRRCGTAHPSA